MRFFQGVLLALFMILALVFAFVLMVEAETGAEPVKATAIVQTSEVLPVQVFVPSYAVEKMDGHLGTAIVCGEVEITLKRPSQSRETKEVASRFIDTHGHLTLTGGRSCGDGIL
jgi:hypothetical protein